MILIFLPNNSFNASFWFLTILILIFNRDSLLIQSNLNLTTIYDLTIVNTRKFRQDQFGISLEGRVLSGPFNDLDESLFLKRRFLVHGELDLGYSVF